MTHDIHEVLGALNHPVRVQIVRTLAVGDFPPLTTKQLASRLALVEARVSHHVSILRRARLVDSHVIGRYSHHVLNPTTMRGLQTFVGELLKGDH